MQKESKTNKNQNNKGRKGEINMENNINNVKENTNNNNIMINKGEINMNNEIKIFSNEEFGNVRTVVDGEIVLFCASDIAKVLGYKKPNNAIHQHCKRSTLQNRVHPQSPTKTIQMVFIPESDVYRLIINSKLPSAEKFENWVFEEVLPSIRKNGFYITDEKLKEFLQESPKNIRKVLLSIKQVKFEELRKSNSMLSSNHKTMIVEFVENLNTKVMKRCYTGSFYTKVYQRMYEDYNIDILNRKETHIRNGQKSLSTLAFIQENEIEQFLSAIFNEYVDGKKTLSVLEYSIHKIREDYTDEYDIFSFLENLVDKYREENKENK